jgi:hypothetical protein
MDEKTQEISTQLTERSEKLREELVDLERQFNTKKEEFLRIQGALEVIQALNKD